MQKELTFDWTRVNNDSNGNPRYVVHYTVFSELLENVDIFDKYREALHHARKLGGKKYHTKSYGGGIVFQSYNLQRDEQNIKEYIASKLSVWSELSNKLNKLIKGE